MISLLYRRGKAMTLQELPMRYMVFLPACMWLNFSTLLLFQYLA